MGSYSDIANLAPLWHMAQGQYVAPADVTQICAMAPTETNREKWQVRVSLRDGSYISWNIDDGMDAAIAFADFLARKREFALDDFRDKVLG